MAMNNYSKELMHHGILGMKWGIRRYQPYGIGYDAKNEGKFVGMTKKDRKRLYKDIANFSKDKTEHKYLRSKSRDKLLKNNKQILEEAVTNPKLQMLLSDQREAGKKLLEAEHNHIDTKKDKHLKEYNKQRQKIEEIDDKIRQTYKEIASELLGEYADKDVKTIYKYSDGKKDNYNEKAKDVLVKFLPIKVYDTLV
jgi:hypothetical protein